MESHICPEATNPSSRAITGAGINQPGLPVEGWVGQNVFYIFIDLTQSDLFIVSFYFYIRTKNSPGT